MLGRKWLLPLTCVLMGVFCRPHEVPAEDNNNHKSRWLKKDLVELIYVDPPPVGLPEGLESIAFIPFTQAIEDKEGIYTAREKKWGNEIIAAIAHKMQQTSRQFDIPLKIVEREAVATIMKEKDLADAGLAEENKALQLGKLAQAQAICFGRVVIDIQTVEGHTPTMRFNPIRGGGIHAEQEYVRRIRRTINLSATVKLVATGTGRSLHTFNHRVSQTADLRPSAFMGRDAQEIQLLPEDDVIKTLMDQVVDDFIAQILPHEVSVEIKIEKPKARQARDAVKYMQLGNLEKAIELYEQGLQSRDNDYGALFNLGLTYEMSGQLEPALRNYELAFKHKDRDSYFQSAQRVRQRIEQARASQQAQSTTSPADNGIIIEMIDESQDADLPDRN